MSMESTPATKKADKVAKTANGLADEADTKISQMARKAESAARRAETALHDGVETLRVQSRVMADEAAKRFDETHKMVAERVRERPITGVLAAAGLGLIVGLLLGGRRR